MDESITRYPSLEAQKELAKHLWPPDGFLLEDETCMERIKTYFRFYLEQCQLFDSAQRQMIRSGCSNALPDVKIETHQDISRLADFFHEGKLDRKNFGDIAHTYHVQLNSPELPSQLTVDLWTDWIARLITMVEIGQVPCSFRSNTPLKWPFGALDGFLSSIFTPEKPYTTSIKLERPFNIVALGRVAGIQVQWTDDLTSHLSLRDDDKTLLLFHHVTFLESVQGLALLDLRTIEAQANASDRDIFPGGFLNETLQTLALLLPSQERDVRRWLKNQNRASLDPAITSLRRLRADDRQISKFHYWRERLTILKEVFDDAEPGTLSQWWYDRRKGPQWYTFWVAIVVLVLTVFFGLVQSVEGALQVWLAWKSGGG